MAHGIVDLLPIHLLFIYLSDPSLESLQQLLPLQRYFIGLHVAPPGKQAALLVENKRLVVILALIRRLMPLLAQLRPINTDSVLFNEPTHLLLGLAHHQLVAAEILPVVLEVVNNFVDYPLVLRVHGQHEVLSLLLTLHEGLRLVQQVYIHHVKAVQVVQVVVEDDVQLLLYFLF